MKLLTSAAISLLLEKLSNPYNQAQISKESPSQGLHYSQKSEDETQDE
jgi:hypothetical protein